MTAIEPAAPMLERLRASVPEVAAVAGSAESIPLPDGHADAVVAGQAFHWFDHPIALVEIARVLRWGGTLGLVWNVRDDANAWVARLSRILGEESMPPDFPIPAIDASGLYGPVAAATFRNEQNVDRSTLIDLVASRSCVATSTSSDRAKILDAVARLYDEEAGVDGLVLPYRTSAYRATRL